MGAEQLTRRRFVQGLAAGGAVAGLGRWEALARAAQPEPSELRGTSLDSRDCRDEGQHHGCITNRPDHQRHASRTAPASARRRDGRPSREERPRRGCVDSLARPHPAGQHGRRARPELPRHPSGRDLHVQVPAQAARDLLVSQPLGVPGAAWGLWPAGHRAARARRDHRRSRARRAPLRLDRREPRAGSPQAEEGIGLLQLPAADDRRFRPGRTCGRLEGDARRPAGVGRDAHERRRPRRRRRHDLYLFDERSGPGVELDRPLHPRRTRAPPLHQRVRHDLFRRPDSRSDLHRCRRRWPAGTSRRRGRAPDRRRGDLRRDCRTVRIRGVHHLRPGHGPHGIRRGHAGRPRWPARAGAVARPASRADDGGHGAWRARWD